MERESQAQATSTPYLPAKGASQPPTPEGRQQPGQTEPQTGRESIMTDMLKDLFQDQVPYWLYFHTLQASCAA